MDDKQLKSSESHANSVAVAVTMDGIEAREKEKEDRRMSRLQKRLATATVPAEEATNTDPELTSKRIRLRSSVGETENPKIIMRISRGKVAEATSLEEDDSKRRSRRDVADAEASSRSGRSRSPLSGKPAGRLRARSMSRGPENPPKGKEKAKSAPSDKSACCWTCHKGEATLGCATCLRLFHPKCVTRTPQDLCPECHAAVLADSENRGNADRVKLDQFCLLLNYTLDRMKNVPDSQVFCKKVDPEEEPEYSEIIRNPMTLDMLAQNIEKKTYGSTVAFLSDAKWILHNSIVYNSSQSPLTTIARNIFKVCKQELEEIDKCPDCYLNAHTKDDWFVQVCKRPHLLVWARLKGFPYWPAKALTTNEKTQMVDARFFGAHDKAWIPVKDCFLLSENCPPSGCKKRGGDIEGAYEEMHEHIENIRKKFGFVYAEDRVPYVPELADKQLTAMMPGWKPVVSKTMTMRVRMEELSPEDQVVRDLEKMAAREASAKHGGGDVVDETSTDYDEVLGESRTPEHGYSINAPGQGANDKDQPPDVQEQNIGNPDGPEKVVLIVEDAADKVKETDESCVEEKDVTNRGPVKKLVEKGPIVEISDKVSTIKLPLQGSTTDAPDKGSANKVDDKPKALDKTPKVASKEIVKAKAVTINPDSAAKLPEAAKAVVSNSKDTAANRQTVVRRPSTSKAAENTEPEFVPVEIKQENLDQYLDEENQCSEVLPDIQPNPKKSVPSKTKIGQPMVTITDLKLLKGQSSTKKLKPSTAGADGKVQLSKEVSLLVVDGEGQSKDAGGSGVSLLKAPPRKPSNKARKSIPRSYSHQENAITISTSSSNEAAAAAAKGLNRNVNVISIDTKNSDAQRNLLKSLSEDKRLKRSHPDGAGMPQGTPPAKESRTSAQKTPTAASTSPATQTVPVQNINSPLLISQNGQTYIAANPQGQNMLMTQNNLGQFSLVPLANLSSGINTNFVNLVNDTIGVQNPFPVITSTAPPPLSPFTGPAGVILTGTGVTSSSGLACSTASTSTTTSNRIPLISVKTTASLTGPAPAPTASSSTTPDPIQLEVQKHLPKIMEITQESIMSILRNVGESLPEAQLKIVNAERSRASWQHQQTVEELKRNYERQIAEMKLRSEVEKQKALTDQRIELDKVIEETKKKQWCALCRREALFYCCWNTSYCDYPCQQQHWLTHMTSCAQIPHASSAAGAANTPTQSRKKIAERNPAFLVRQNGEGPSLQGNGHNTQGPAVALSTYSGPGSRKKHC